MNIYRLHFEGSWAYEFDVEAFDKEDALKIGKEMFDVADANEFDIDNDPAPKVTLLENDDD